MAVLIFFPLAIRCSPLPPGYVLERGRIHHHSDDRCLEVWVVPGMCGHNEPAILCNSTDCFGEVTACKTTLKNIGCALDAYSTDNQGRFPARLSQLCPRYLKVMPTCFHAAKDTYSCGYVAADSAYTVVCSGDWHCNVDYRPNFPQYTSSEGLLER